MAKHSSFPWSHLADFPPEVADRLASVDRVRLEVGAPGNVLPVDALPAPLRGQMYLLIRPCPEIEARIRQAGQCALIAEPPDRAWSVQSRGQLVLGRRASTDTRRSELAHWIPENETAGAYLALPFYPESLDYQYDAPDGRRRANGPIPGTTRVSSWRSLATVGGGNLWPWFFASGILQSFGLLVLGSPEHRNIFVLLLVLASGILPVLGAKLAFAPLDMERWRRGYENDAAVGAIRRSGVAEGALAAAGVQILVVSAVCWMVLLWSAGSVVVGTSALLSGAPVIVLVMAVRRRSAAPIPESA